MRVPIDRRSFLQAGVSLLVLALSGCADREMLEQPTGQETDKVGVAEGQDYAAVEGEQAADEQGANTSQPGEGDSADQEDDPMQISVTVNGTSFTATTEDTEAGRALLARLPLTLQMEELHGNEKYCYTGESFGGEQQVPDMIEAGDLMVFGSDCLVLFYETFANGGWSYARVGRIDDPSGLAEACGSGTATVEFAPLS